MLLPGAWRLDRPASASDLGFLSVLLSRHLERGLGFCSQDRVRLHRNEGELMFDCSLHLEGEGKGDVKKGNIYNAPQCKRNLPKLGRPRKHNAQEETLAPSS